MTNWASEWVDDTYERELAFEHAKYEQPDPESEPPDLDVPQDRTETRETE